jgi:hypothetical protein
MARRQHHVVPAITSRHCRVSGVTAPSASVTLINPGDPIARSSRAIGIQ